MPDGFGSQFLPRRLEGANATNTPAQRWGNRVTSAEKEFQSWRNRAREIIKIYTAEKERINSGKRTYALLWANTEVLKPTVYSRPPNPSVTRRFRDKDPVGRQVADVLERSLVSQFELNDLDDVIRDARDDFILVGRGTVWIRYEVAFAQDDPDRATDEDIVFDHVHWSDFIHPKRRKWRDVPWVARRVHMDADALEKRFGKEKAKMVRQAREAALNDPANGSQQAEDRGKRNQPTIEVFEIWDRISRRVYWLVKGMKEFLDERRPAIKLRGFFPCPKPAYGTHATDSLVPIPDYDQYRDQAEEINDLTERISTLTEALKLVGFYPAAMDGQVSQAIEQAARPSNTKMLVPVPGWASFVTGGGAAALIQWWPVEQVIATLTGAFEARRSLIGDIFQITGISDIVRGESDPRETLGAQELKSQFGSVRIRDKQREIQRFIADVTKISAEIIAELFDQETIARITNIDLPTRAEVQQRAAMQRLFGAPQMAPGADMQLPALMGTDGMMEAPDQDPTQQEVTWDDVMEVLRDDRTRSYRVEIETDSTLEPDEASEKAARNEFLDVVAGYLERVGPLLQSAPQLGRMLGAMLMFQVRAYKVGRELEQIIEETVDQLVEEALANQGDETPPEVQIEEMRTQAKMEGERMAQELKAAQAQADAVLKQQELQQKAQIAAAELELKREAQAGELELQRQKTSADLALERLKIEADMDIKRKGQLADLEMKLRELQSNADEVAMGNATEEEANQGRLNEIQELARELTTGFAAAMNAPREVVRDGSGRITGSIGTAEQ